MATTIGSNGLLQQEKVRHGMKFRNDATEEVLVVEVIDKFPLMGDIHIEGRRVVEVSIEMFVELMVGAGFRSVPPEGDSNE